ncbi:MAG: dienelactone hydrolase family protein [Pseudomonadales bacterium]|nr:dienelactone hydrolase family protein [Pseudomonadales bacterium]
MCDEDTLYDAEEFLRTRGITRRQFTGAVAGTAVALMLPRVANAKSVVESDVVIATPDGQADCYFVRPAEGSHPAVLIWPDILGLRPAFRLMGKRLAESGYAVLVVNPYYRLKPSPVVSEGASFRDPAVRETVLPLARSLSPETNVTDAKAFIAFLDKQPEVDTRKKIGTTGYCMGGPMVMRTAAAVASRVGAAATFHGGGLATDADNSPHLLIPQMKASFLIAIAENDDQKDPVAKQTLRTHFDEAGLPAEIEVYEGALHGWCPPDSAVYNEQQAERAWSRLLDLFSKALV